MARVITAPEETFLLDVNSDCQFHGILNELALPGGGGISFAASLEKEIGLPGISLEFNILIGAPLEKSWVIFKRGIKTGYAVLS
jgi:hypothetical protein